MAIVETLEVRFQANLGKFKSQISGVIGNLNNFSAVSEKTNNIFVSFRVPERFTRCRCRRMTRTLRRFGIEFVII